MPLTLRIAGIGSDKNDGGFRGVSLEDLFEDETVVVEDVDGLIVELVLDDVDIADEVTDEVGRLRTELVFDATNVANDDVDEFEGLLRP